jgi:hypothetical protein
MFEFSFFGAPRGRVFSSPRIQNARHERAAMARRSRLSNTNKRKTFRGSYRQEQEVMIYNGVDLQVCIHKKVIFGEILVAFVIVVAFLFLHQSNTHHFIPL